MVLQRRTVFQCSPFFRMMVIFVLATPSPQHPPLPLTVNKKVSCTLGCLWSPLCTMFIKRANLFLLLSTSEAGAHLCPPPLPHHPHNRPLHHHTTHPNASSTPTPLILCGGGGGGVVLMASGWHPASAGTMAQDCH